MPKKIGNVICGFEGIVGDGSDLAIDFGEEFELSFWILDDLAVVAADEESVIDFDGGVEGRVDLEDFFSIC